MRKALIHQTPAEKLANNSASTISAIQQNTTEVIKALKANTPDNTELIEKLQENKQKLDEVKSASLITNQQGKKSNELLEKIAERKESAVVSLDTGDAEIITITGDKGEAGPAGKDGKDGMDGRDGVDGLDGQDGVAPTVAEIMRHVRVPKDGEHGRDGIDGRDGKDGSPDDPDTIVDIVNKSTKQIDHNKVKGLAEMKMAVDRYGTNPQGVSGGGKTYRIKTNGVDQAHVTTLNFEGATYDGDGLVTVTVGGGGGNVTKVGTPVNNQVGVWTGDGTIEGDTAFTFNTTTNTVTLGVENGTGFIGGPDALTTNFLGGRLHFRGGNGNGTGNGGGVNFIGGYGGLTSGIGGNIYCEGGGSDTAAGGSVFFQGGNGVTNGTVRILDVATQNAAILDTTLLVTADRTFTFPDISGTFALLAQNANFNTLTVNTNLVPDANDGAALGTTTLQFSDLFLATGAVINFNNGNATLTHSAGLLTSSVPVSLGTVNALTAGSLELGHATDTTIARSGAGAITVEGVQVILSGAALGTPSSATLTNATGLPVAGITASTVTALGVGSIELGHATDTTLSRSAAGVLAVEGVVIPSISSTNTLTNKRVTPRVLSAANNASLTPEKDTYDIFHLTAMSANTTINNHSTSTPADGETMIFRFLDNGTARTLTWGTAYVAKGGIALPSTTVLSKNLALGFQYDSNLAKWNLIASAQSA